MILSRLITVPHDAQVAVEVDGHHLLIKLRRVRAADLLRAGVTPIVDPTQDLPQPGESPQEHRERLKQAYEAALLEGRLSSRMLIYGLDAQEVRLCAGVVALSGDGGQTWQPLHLVRDYQEASPTQNRVWVGALAPAFVAAVQQGLLALEGQTQEAGEGLASFRGAGAAPA